MFAAIRAFAKSWVAAILIGLLIISFAVFGITDVFNGSMQGNAVVAVGERKVQPFEFKRLFEQYKAGLEQQNGRAISVQELAANGVDSQVLEEVATRTAFAEYLRKSGVLPSDKLLVSQINSIPAFFDQVSGRFDRKAYEQTLAQNELSTAMYERSIREDLAEQHFVAAFHNGLQAPRAYAALAAIYGLETRDISYVTVDPQDVTAPKPPTEAQLAAFMKESERLLTRPEMRVMTLAIFSPAVASQSVKIDEAAVQKQFEFRKDTLSTPETRSLVQIPAKDQATAGQIVQRLNKGETPTVIAKSIGVDVINYKDKPKTAVADRKLADAAFKLAAGATATVQGDIGLAVIKVLDVTPGRAVTLDEVRPELEAEVRKDAAAEKVYAQSQVYDDTHQGGASLAESAKTAGVPVTTLGPVTAQGADAEGRPVPGVNEKILATAFNLPAGGESDLTEAGDGVYFAVRVEKVIPAAMPALSEIRGELTQVWMMREMEKRLQARADSLVARIEKGEPIDKVAGSVTHLTGIDRASASEQKSLSSDLLGKLFAAKQGDVLTAANTRFGLLVVKVDKVSAGDPKALAQTVALVRPQMTRQVFQELGVAARNGARQGQKVKVNPNAARQAIGLEPLVLDDDARGAKTGAAK